MPASDKGLQDALTDGIRDAGPAVRDRDDDGAVVAGEPNVDFATCMLIGVVDEVAHGTPNGAFVDAKVDVTSDVERT